MALMTSRQLASAALVALALTGCANIEDHPSTPVPVTLDVQQFLAASGASFEPQPAPTSVRTSADAAIAIVRAQITGTPGATSAVFGRLRDPQLGLRNDRFAWMVTIDGAAPPRQSPSGPPVPVGGPLRTVAFIDAEDGFNLETIATGVGP